MRGTSYLSILVIGCLGCANIQTIRNVHSGMSEDEVRMTMGKPDNITKEPDETYHYRLMKNPALYTVLGFCTVGISWLLFPLFQTDCLVKFKDGASTLSGCPGTDLDANYASQQATTNAMANTHYDAPSAGTYMQSQPMRAPGNFQGTECSAMSLKPIAQPGCHYQCQNGQWVEVCG